MCVPLSSHSSFSVRRHRIASKSSHLFPFHSHALYSNSILFLFFICSTDATPAEAVKRKIPAEADATDAVVADEVSPTPEKKSKLEEAAKENGSAAAEAEVVA